MWSSQANVVYPPESHRLFLAHPAGEIVAFWKNCRIMWSIKRAVPLVYSMGSVWLASLHSNGCSLNTKHCSTWWRTGGWVRIIQIDKNPNTVGWVRITQTDENHSTVGFVRRIQIDEYHSTVGLVRIIQVDVGNSAFLLEQLIVDELLSIWTADD